MRRTLGVALDKPLSYSQQLGVTKIDHEVISHVTRITLDTPRRNRFEVFNVHDHRSRYSTNEARLGITTQIIAARRESRMR